MNPMLTDMMIDIETLGTGKDAAVISMGAVMFNPYTGAVQPREDAFYGVLDINDPLIGVMDPSTVAWWLTQSEAARMAIARPENPASAKDFAEEFINWTKIQRRDYGDVEALWSNGPLFDERIMRRFFERVGRKFPVHFRRSACCRTRARFARELGYDTRANHEFVGVEHNALDDAISQCAWISDATQWLANGREKA